MKYFLDKEFLEGTQDRTILGIKYGKTKPTIDLIENKYYLYRHIRLDKNEVFYVGIGTKRNNNDYSRAYSKLLRNKWWNNIINKTSYRIEIVLESNKRGFICEKEKEFIKLYGRKNLNKGSLVNLTDGGEGAVGAVVSDVTRKLHSLHFKNNKYRLGKYHSEEVKLKMSKDRIGKKHPMYGKKHKESTIEKFRIAQTGSKKSEDTKRKHRERTKLPNQCNKKPCKLIDTETNECWLVESVFQLSLIAPISKSTLNKLKNNKSVTKRYKKYKIIEL